MKPLYRTLALVAVFGMFYAGMERKGSFDTEGRLNPNAPVETPESDAGGKTGDVIIVTGATDELPPQENAGGKTGDVIVVTGATSGGGSGGTGDVVIISGATGGGGGGTGDVIIVSG